MSGTISLLLLLPLRLLVGTMLLLEGYQKLTGGWFHGDVLQAVLTRWLAEQKPAPFFLPVVQSAHAHPKVFGVLVTLGELVVGTSMTLGLAARFGAILGTLLMASIAIASGQGLAPPGNAVLMGAILFTFVLAPPGRVLGFDRAMAGRLPRWMT